MQKWALYKQLVLLKNPDKGISNEAVEVQIGQ